jgi:hypothetical protein
LVEARIRELGLSKSVVVSRWGYKNLGKGLRRLKELLDGSFVPKIPDSLKNLAAAIELDASVVQSAYNATRSATNLAAKDAYEKCLKKADDRFEPSAFIVTDGEIPWPLSISRIYYVRRYIRLTFDYTTSPSAWIDEIRAKLPKTTPFGNVVGFMINDKPRHAIQYDRNGNEIRSFSRAISLVGPPYCTSLAEQR